VEQDLVGAQPLALFGPAASLTFTNHVGPARTPSRPLATTAGAGRLVEGIVSPTPLPRTLLSTMTRCPRSVSLAYIGRRQSDPVFANLDLRWYSDQHRVPFRTVQPNRIQVVFIQALAPDVPLSDLQHALRDTAAGPAPRCARPLAGAPSNSDPASTPIETTTTDSVATRVHGRIESQAARAREDHDRQRLDSRTVQKTSW